MIYLDTSAAVKLIEEEDESSELALFLAERISTPLVSSALLQPELMRALTRIDPAYESRGQALLHRVMRVPVSHQVLTEAATIGGPSLRTLDAIHLSTATTIAERLTAFVTYDKRLAKAAEASGLDTESPA